MPSDSPVLYFEWGGLRPFPFSPAQGAEGQVQWPPASHLRCQGTVYVLLPRKIRSTVVTTYFTMRGKPRFTFVSTIYIHVTATFLRGHRHIIYTIKCTLTFCLFGSVILSLHWDANCDFPSLIMVYMLIMSPPPALAESVSPAGRQGIDGSTGLLLNRLVTCGPWHYFVVPESLFLGWSN